MSDRFGAIENPSFGTKILNKLRRLKGPLWRESSDCKQRSKHFADADLLGEYMEKDAYSMADVAPLSEGTVEEETQALTHELKRIASAMHLDKFPDSHLSRSINQFLAAG